MSNFEREKKRAEAEVGAEWVIRFCRFLTDDLQADFLWYRVKSFFLAQGHDYTDLLNDKLLSFERFVRAKKARQELHELSRLSTDYPRLGDTPVDKLLRRTPINKLLVEASGGGESRPRTLAKEKND